MSDPQTTLVDLSLEQIESGNLLLVVNESITNACKDAIERCNIGKEWIVVVKIKLKPLPDPNNYQTTYLDVAWECKMTPPGQSGTITRGLVYKGKVQVNQTNFAEPDQETNSHLKFAKK